MSQMNSQTTSTLRLWPGVLAVALAWASKKIPEWIFPGEMIQMQMMMFGGMLSLAIFLIWWLFFSRIPWADRMIVLVASIVIGATANALCDKSYKGMFFMFFALPVGVTAWVGWLLMSQKMGWPNRRAGLLLVILVTFGAFTLIRHDGVDSYFNQDLAFRWTPTNEEKYVARVGPTKPVAKLAAVESAKPLESQSGDWIGFRGPARDSRLTGVTINSNWNDNPPRELWRHDVGPGWSSFCVVGDHVFTQEQHDKQEAVVCYHAYTGNKIWEHHDDQRFWDTISGAGPRATPTFHEGKLYTMGAAGRLNCLDAGTGKVIWTRNIVTDSKAKVPDWGFSASPLVANGLVTVYCGGPNPEKRKADDDPHNSSILAYKAESGEPAWKSGNTKFSYCSVHAARLSGIDQYLFVGGDGLNSYDPSTGKQLWHYDWDLGEGFNRCTQPTILNETDLLIGSGFGSGTQRVHVTRDDDKWKAEKVWASKAISPYYSDLVIYNDFAYGFDTNGFLNCVDLKKGERKWKVRGYDNGQVLLLADQGVLLVQCEKGDVALVAARPDKHEEIARIKGLGSKTWNHPVIANGKLFIRNDREAACFELKADEPRTK